MRVDLNWVCLFGALLLGVGGARGDDISAPAVVDTIFVETPTYLASTSEGDLLAAVSFGGGGADNQGSVTIWDTATNTAIGTVLLAVGFPAEIAIPSGSTQAYVAVSDFSGSTDSNGANARLDVIDLTSASLVASIPVPGASGVAGPSGVCVHPDGSRVYLSVRGLNRVDVVDLVTSQVSSIPVGVGPFGIDISPDGSRVYVANRTSSDVTVIDTVTESVVETIPVSVGPSGSSTSVVIDPVELRAYVAFADSGTVAAIDIDNASPSLHSVTEIPTSGTTIRSVALNVEDRVLLATCQSDDLLAVICLDSTAPEFETEVTTVCIESGPWDALFTEPGSYRGYASLVGSGNLFEFGPEELFIRGDMNGDGIVDGVDVQQLEDFLYATGAAVQPLNCSGSFDLDVADVNDDERCSLGDLLLLIDAVAGCGGPGVPEPSRCGVDCTAQLGPPAATDLDFAVNAESVTVVGAPSETREVAVSLRVSSETLPIQGVSIAVDFGVQLAPAASIFVPAPGVSPDVIEARVEGTVLLLAVGRSGCEELLPAGALQPLGSLNFELPPFATFAPVQWVESVTVGGVEHRTTIVDTEYQDHWPELSSGDFEFARGNSNNDGVVDLADAVHTLAFLFSGGDPAPCADAADANDDGVVDISDAVTTLCVLFTGCAPVQPSPQCGLDVQPDALPSCAGIATCP